MRIIILAMCQSVIQKYLADGRLPVISTDEEKCAKHFLHLFIQKDELETFALTEGCRYRILPIAMNFFRS